MTQELDDFYEEFGIANETREKAVEDTEDDLSEEWGDDHEDRQADLRANQ